MVVVTDIKVVVSAGDTRNDGGRYVLQVPSKTETDQVYPQSIDLQREAEFKPNTLDVMPYEDSRPSTDPLSVRMVVTVGRETAQV